MTFDLNTGIFKPYIKPNDIPLYVNRQSNHPPSIIKQIPTGVNKRLSSISSNEEVFKNALPIYQDSLKRSGYDFNFKYDPEAGNSNKRRNRNRSRNVTWFNPPYSENIATNIGAKFLHIIDRCFPQTTFYTKWLTGTQLK